MSAKEDRNTFRFEKKGLVVEGDELDDGTITISFDSELDEECPMVIIRPEEAEHFKDAFDICSRAVAVWSQARRKKER